MTENTPQQDKNIQDLNSVPEELITHVHQSHLNSVLNKVIQQPDEVIHLNSSEKNSNPFDIEQRKNMIIESLAKHLGFDEKNLTQEQSEQILRTVFENIQQHQSDISNVAQDLIINSTLTNYQLPQLNLKDINLSDKTFLNNGLTEENIAAKLKNIESNISSMRDKSFTNYNETKKPKHD